MDSDFANKKLTSTKWYGPSENKHPTNRERLNPIAYKLPATLYFKVNKDWL